MNLPDALLHALLWMLVHSLWIGLLAAAGAGLAMALTRHRPPALRYNLLVSIGALFVASALGTFVLYYYNFGTGTINAPASPLAGSAGNSLTGTITGGSNWLQAAILFLDNHAAVITGTWLLLFCFRAVRLIQGYRELRELRTRALEPADGYWQQRLGELCAQIGLSQTVRLFGSGLAKVPMVVGVLKPVVLVPAGFLSGLPPESIEAILLHELAHIRRRDPIVNAAQGFVELLFFFNPPLLWLSDRIRTEREHCCDDLAVAASGNTRGYINALVTFQEYSAAPAYATAFNGSNHMPLLDRVKRLIHHQNKTLNPMEKIGLLAGLVAVTVIGTAFYQQQEPAAPPPPPTVKSAPAPAPPPPPPPADTSIKGVSEIQYPHNGKTYRFTLTDGKLTGLTIDGKPVPQSRFGDHDRVFRSALQKHQEARDAAQVHREKSLQMAAEADAMHAKSKELQVEVNELNEEVRDLNVTVGELNEKQKEISVSRAEHQKAMAEHDKRANEHVSRMREHARTVEEHARIAKEHERLAKEHAALAQEHARHAQVSATVVRELVKDGIVKEGANVSFSFNDDTFVVNGKEQPEAVSRKYRKLVTDEKQRLGIR